MLADLVVAHGVTISWRHDFQFPEQPWSVNEGTVLSGNQQHERESNQRHLGHLADGLIITVNGNNCQASHSGSGGNDLTLTVVL